jgi:sugar O-acyltransferase (sialic acid O-acetyltransferase NeuD family)
MRQYFILGSGGFAKEVLFLAQESIPSSEAEFGGFIEYDPKTNTIDCIGGSHKVLDENQFIKDYTGRKEIDIYIGIGTPSILKKLMIVFQDFNFPNLIHPNFVHSAKSITMGRGNIITAGCVFTVDIKVGSFNIFNLNVTLGHDSVVGDCNVMNPGVNISGGVQMGNANLIGTNATVLQYIKIGSNNVVGASSLVTKPVEDNQVMVGVPAKPMNR